MGFPDLQSSSQSLLHSRRVAAAWEQWRHRPRGATALRTDAYPAPGALRGKLLLGIAIPWVAALVSLLGASLAFGERYAFSCSLAATAVGIAALWRMFLRRLDPRIPFLPIGLVFAAKCGVSYWLWTARYMTPGPENKVLQTGRQFQDIYKAVVALKETVRYWQLYGFTPWIPESYYLPTNHRFPVVLHAVPCYLSANYAEVAIPWNAFYSLVTAATVLAISRLCGLDPARSRRAFYTALLMPFSWVVAGPFKDILLQTCMGLVLLAFVAARDRPLSLILIVPMSALLLSGFRPPYLLFVIAFAVYTAFWSSERKSVAPWVLLSATVLFAIIAADLLRGTVGLYFSPAAKALQYATPLNLDQGPFSPVKRIVVGLLTPFPWTQPFELGLAGWAQVPDYAQATVTLGVLSVVIPLLARQLAAGQVPGLPAVFAFLFMLSGMFNPIAIHATYVQVAAVFLLPEAYRIGARRLGKNILASFALMVLGNVVWLSVR